MGACSSSGCGPARRRRPGAFLLRRSPAGNTWAEHLRSSGRPLVDLDGLVEGPWAECVASACVFEANNPDWSRQREYCDDGPAGQVLLFLQTCGHGDLRGPLGRTEDAAHAAIQAGRTPQPLQSVGAVNAVGVPMEDATFAGQGIVQGRPVTEASGTAPAGSPSTGPALDGPLKPPSGKQV